jgi:MiaB-like tRNA modifying enzyme
LKVFIETYGCTLNNADSDVMNNILESAGHTVDRGTLRLNEAAKYDYIILNTCTVKKPTEQKIISKLERISNLNKNLVVTGCLASATPDIIKKASPTAKILKTSETIKILNTLNPNIKKTEDAEKPSFINSNGIIARIPISEGCLSNCSFCETKFARGPLKSFDENVILKAISRSINNGSYEIELTSQDIGAYGADKKTNIAELATHAASLDGDFMLRIGMLNPEHLHKYLDSLIDALKQKKVFKFLHLPIQSGSNKILKDMQRNYTVDEVRYYFEYIRSKIPNITISTDIIVGYPTESINDFKLTEDLLFEIKPAITNISKFWQRPHTKASKLQQITANEIKRRSTILSREIREMQVSQYNKFIGLKEDVVITENNNGLFSGRDIYYRPVAVLSKKLNLGEKVTVEVTDTSYACIISKPI